MVGVIAAALALVGTVAVPVSAGADPISPRGTTCLPAPSHPRDVRLVPAHLRVDGIRIAYACLGAGRPLLLLNGTASPMSQWDPALLAALAAHRRRVLVLDYPGLGASDLDVPAGTFRFARMADLVAGLLRRVGLRDGVDVLGWSMGGFVAQQLAVRHPGLVSALVLAGTSPGSPRTVLGPRWVQEADSDPNAGLGTFLRTNFPPSARADGRAFLRRLAAALDSGRYPPDVVPDRTYRGMVAAEDPWLRSSANLRALPRVRVPALVVTGAGDVVTPPANSRLLAAALPRVRLVLVPGAGHAFLFQQPGRTSALVSAFLDATG